MTPHTHTLLDIASSSGSAQDPSPTGFACKTSPPDVQMALNFGITGTASLQLQGRNSPDDSWRFIGSAITSSQVVLQTKMNYMKVTVASSTAGAVLKVTAAEPMKPISASDARSFAA